MTRYAVRWNRRCRLAVAAVLLLFTVLGVGCLQRPSAERGLIYGSLFEPNTLNPLLAPDVASRQAIELVYDGLIAASDTFELVPRLAESWEVSEDGRTWTFHLRKGVKWHDGRDFSAEDVAFTYRAIVDPESDARLPRGDYAVLERVEVVDPATVRFVLSRPYAPLLSRLTVGIVPKHRLEGQSLAGAALNRQPIGTGPFVLKEWQAAQWLTFEANPGYYGGRPSLDRIVWKVVPDSAALTMQLLGGEVDAALVADPQDRAAIRSGGRFAVFEALGGSTQISFQLDGPLFQDRRVRRALALGLDVRAIVDGVMRGEARLATSDVPPSSWAYDPKVEPIQADLPAARRLLAEAGWTPGPDGVYARDGRPLAFTLRTYAGDRVREAVLLVVRQQWRDLGLEVEVATQERNSFVSGRVLKGDFEAALLESSVPVDPDLSRRFHSASIKAGQNFLGYRSARLDALLDRGVASVDRDARRQVYAEAQRVLLDDLPQIPLFHATQLYAFPKGFEGVRPTPLGPFWNVAEWKLRR